ncbi:hypothetical protein JCM9279_004752 [Rhodotorula babjevae]
MQLVLAPPSSLPIPLRLQTHEIPTPVLDTKLGELRSPRGFLVARRTLKNVGLKQENELAFDSTAWWQIVVRSVEWDLEGETVVVTLIDGTEERWDLAALTAQPRSEAVVEEEDMSAHGRGDDEKDGDIEIHDGTTSRRASSWAPSAVIEHLHAFCIDLRSAYEDLGMAHEYDDQAHELGSDDNWSTLQDLSADPKMKVSFRLSDAQTYFEYAMDGHDDEDDSGSSQDCSRSTRSARQPSQAASVGGDDEDKADPDKFSGQFLPHYRARSTKASLAVDESRRRHDYLSTVHLLTCIRAYLADLFARTVIPKLRETLPATYSLWAASSAIVWCRREAIKLGAEVARLMIDLLEDDGDVFDADSESEPSQLDILVIDDADEYSLDTPPLGSADLPRDNGSGGLGGVHDELAEWRAEERRIQRLSENVLVSLQGDFELRRWCEAALERARTLTLSGDGIVEVAPPRWTEPVRAQEVSHSLDGDDSDLDEPPSKRVFEHQVPLALRPRLTLSAAASPPTSPPPETDLPVRKRARSADDMTASDASTYSGSSDDDDDDLDSSIRFKPDFFYPEDPLDEEFLPPRLPKELVRASASRGLEMEEHRARIHALLNKINGLQHKIVELQDFVAKEATRWENYLEEARKPKDATARLPSGLRSIGPSERSPPPPEKTDKPVPLKAQPLRKQAADRALAFSLDSALSVLRSPIRPDSLPHVQVPAIQVQTAAPRRKQKSNLETFVKVVAMSGGVVPPPPTSTPTSRPSQPSKKKRKLAKGSSVGAHTSHDPGRSPSKRARRRKLVKHEGASANLALPSSSSAQQVFGSTTTTAAAASAPPVLAQDPRHLAALELSNRRRGAVAAAGGRMPLAWAEDESDEDELDELWTGDEDDGSSLAPARSSTDETSRYWDESDSSDDEAGELELVDVDVPPRSRGDSPERPRSPSSPSPERRADSPYRDEYEAPTRPGSAAVSMSPSPILRTPSLLVLPSLAPLFPLSAERSALEERSTLDVVADAAGGGATSHDDEPFVFAPRPRRPTSSTLARASTAAAIPSDIPSSPSSSSPSSSPPDSSSELAPAAEPSLAQRVRDRLACVANPPVQLVPPLTLDWPDEAAPWYRDDERDEELVLGLEVGDEGDVDPNA